jgi:DNA-binding NtrC family response regulator
MALRERDVDAPRDVGGVLVVDDEFSMRDSLVHWFEKDGYRTGSAQDAREALRLLEQGPWDAVLLDIKMPGMDGLELQRRIREVDPELPIIMITAFASVDSAVQARRRRSLTVVDPDERAASRRGRAAAAAAGERSSGGRSTSSPRRRRSSARAARCRRC